MKLLLAAIALFVSTSAFAANVDFSTVVTDADGAAVADCAGSDCAGKPPLTLGRIALHALTATFEDEKNLAGEEKFKRGQFAMRVYKGDTVTLNAEDTALLKRLIAKAYGPLVVIKTWPLLDPSEKAP